VLEESNATNEWCYFVFFPLAAREHPKYLQTLEVQTLHFPRSENNILVLEGYWLSACSKIFGFGGMRLSKT
jgi:hypothetical protein